MASLKTKDQNHIIFWHEAYELIAKLLLEFNELHGSNTSQELYSRLENSEFRNLNEARLFNQRPKSDNPGLDPVQIFATFNFPKITTRRILIINCLFKEFGTNKYVSDDTSFEGIPLIIITQVIKYRSPNAQEQIWKMFSSVMQTGRAGFAAEHFNNIKTWKGLDIASTTIFLFWIRSQEFIPLDANTLLFLRSFNLIESRPRSVEDYWSLCDRIKVANKNKEKSSVFRNIVKDAYGFSRNVKSDNILSGSTASTISNLSYQETSEEEVEKIAIRKQKTNGFQIIALRPSPQRSKTKQRHIKNLHPGQLYQFYSAYKFGNNDNIIRYDQSLEVDLYSKDGIRISVCSIVGKNGSGKSTIADFLYLIINKIAFTKGIKPSERLIDEEVYADLFVKSDTLYKISVGKEIEVIEYELKENNEYKMVAKKEDSARSFQKFDIEGFCYSIVINYSMYALNTNHTGNWIYPLFHKNDSYQVPLALNPLRENGNIDVNREEGLAKSRMISNILDPTIIDNNDGKMPELVPGSRPIRFQLELDEEKMTRKKLFYEKKYKRKLLSRDINKFISALKIKNSKVLKFSHEAKSYIYLKAVAIANNYHRFRQFSRLPYHLNDKNYLENYIQKLNEETSHITFKLRQAINYLKFGIYNKPLFDALSVAGSIKKIQDDNEAKTIDLVPPAFFKSEVVFDHGGTFNELSSGEKQQILSINTVAYQLYNISSVMYDEESYKYNNVNIIFDEVELYFHPEMQRTYIYNLLERISTLNLSQDIHNINMMFITHSPFILSDIPASNILRISTQNKIKKSLPVVHTEHTFGANIHDLLANEFFLNNGYMGKLADNIIKSTLTDLQKWKPKKNNKDQVELGEKIFKIIQLIGEPLLKESLMDLYREKIGVHESEYTRSEIIEYFEKFERLKNTLQ